MVLGRIVLVFVDAQHNGQIFAFGRSRNDDFLRAAGSDVIDCAFDSLTLLVDTVFLDGEQTGRFNDDVNAEVTPFDGGGVGFLENLDLLAIDDETVISNFHCAVEATISRIVFQQVRHGLRITNVVERDHFQFIRIHIANGFQHLASDSSKSVNTNFCCHVRILQ